MFLLLLAVLRLARTQEYTTASLSVGQIQPKSRNAWKLCRYFLSVLYAVVQAGRLTDQYSHDLQFWGWFEVPCSLLGLCRDRCRFVDKHSAVLVLCFYIYIVIQHPGILSLLFFIEAQTGDAQTKWFSVKFPPYLSTSSFLNSKWNLHQSCHNFFNFFFRLWLGSRCENAMETWWIFIQRVSLMHLTSRRTNITLTRQKRWRLKV